MANNEPPVTLVTVASALCPSKHDIAEPSGDFFDSGPRLFYAFGYCSESPRDVASLRAKGTSSCKLVFTPSGASYARLRPLQYMGAECFLLGFDVNDAAGFKEEVLCYIEELAKFHQKAQKYKHDRKSYVKCCPPIVLLAMGERTEGCVSPEAVASVVAASGGMVDDQVLNFAWNFPPYKRGDMHGAKYAAVNDACATAMRPALDAILMHCHERGMTFRIDQQRRNRSRCLLQ